MSKKKLSKKLRELILRNPSKVQKKDLSKEALTYLNRVQGAAKARAIKAAKYFKVGSLSIPKESAAYKRLERLARQKGQTVKDFVKVDQGKHEKFLKTFRTYYDTYTEKLEQQLEQKPKKGRVYNQENKSTVAEALKDIAFFRSFTIQKGFYPFIKTELGKDQIGNFFIEIPTMKQLLNLDEDEISSEDYENWINENFPRITIFSNSSNIPKAS